MTKEEILIRFHSSMNKETDPDKQIYLLAQASNDLEEQGNEVLSKKVLELEAECFKLAAMACIKPTADDWGNRTCDDKPICTMIERVKELELALKDAYDLISRYDHIG